MEKLRLRDIKRFAWKEIMAEVSEAQAEAPPTATQCSTEMLHEDCSALI